MCLCPIILDTFLFPEVIKESKADDSGRICIAHGKEENCVRVKWGILKEETTE
jgi:hypothetical protein